MKTLLAYKMHPKYQFIFLRWTSGDKLSNLMKYKDGLLSFAKFENDYIQFVFKKTCLYINEEIIYSGSESDVKPSIISLDDGNLELEKLKLVDQLYNDFLEIEDLLEVFKVNPFSNEYVVCNVICVIDSFLVCLERYYDKDMKVIGDKYFKVLI